MKTSRILFSCAIIGMISAMALGCSLHYVMAGVAVGWSTLIMMFGAMFADLGD